LSIVNKEVMTRLCHLHVCDLDSFHKIPSWRSDAEQRDIMRQLESKRAGHVVITLRQALWFRSRLSSSMTVRGDFSLNGSIPALAKQANALLYQRSVVQSRSDTPDSNAF